MSQLALSRRQFLFGIPALGAIVGGAWPGTFAIAQSQADRTIPQYFDPGRDIYNYVEQRNGTPDDRAYAYDVVLQLLRVTSSASWQSMSEQARAQQIAQLAGGRVAPAQRSLTLTQTTKMVFTAFGATLGTGLAVALMTRNTAVIARALSRTTTQLPVALKAADTILEAGVGVYGGYEILKDTAAAFNTTGAAVIRSATKSGGAGGNFDLNSQFPGLKLAIDKDFSLTSTGLLTPEQEMISFVTQNKGAMFNSEADLRLFMETYVDKVADVQQASLERLIEAQKKIALDNAAAARAAALRERDMAALFQSVNNVVGLAIDRFAAPKEAEVLKTLIGAGFQYALSSMTPMGWAAVGINVGMTVFGRSKSGGFEKAVTKMLKHITKQLDTIIDGISDIQKSQVEIFYQISSVLKRIELLEVNIDMQFDALRSKLDVIYSQARSQARDEIRVNFMSLHAKLVDVYTLRIGDPLPLLQAMRDVAQLKSSSPVLTARAPGVVTSGMMVDLLLAGQRRPVVPTPLYDFIGLLTAFSSYNASSGSGLCTTEISHPVEFYNVTSTMINWMLLLDIDEKVRRSFLAQLRASAVQNLGVINSLCQKSNVETLAQNYLTAANAFLVACREVIDREISDSAEHSALGKQLTLTPQRMPDLSGIKDLAIKPMGVDTFLNNNNDSLLFNLAKELGIVTEVKTVSFRPVERSRVYDFKRMIMDARLPANPDQYFPSWKIGTELSRKSNLLVLKSTLINAELGLALTCDVPYESGLYMDAFDYDWGGCRNYGHDGDNYGCSRLYRNVSAASAKLHTPSNWKASIEKAMQTAGYDAATVFPALATMQTPVDLVTYLVGEWATAKKARVLKNVRAKLLAPNFAGMDGAGLSLAVVSKLNEVVTTKDELVPFELDYIKDAFIREDFANTLVASAYFDNRYGLDKDTFNQILADFNNQSEVPYLQLVRPNGTRAPKLDPRLLPDFVTIMLSKQAFETATRCKTKARTVEAEAKDPYLALTLAKLDTVLALFAST